MSDPSPWFVYLLECADGSVYTGITTDVERRFGEHRAGTGARYTRSRVPVAVLGQLPCADRSEASRLEAAIKRLRAADKREFCRLLNGGDICAARVLVGLPVADLSVGVADTPGPV